MQFLAYNSKTEALRENLTWDNIVYQVTIYLLWNFQIKWLIGCSIHLKISGQINLDLINNFIPCQICSKCFGF